MNQELPVARIAALAPGCCSKHVLRAILSLPRGNHSSAQSRLQTPRCSGALR